MIEKVKTWIMENKMIAIVIGALAVLFIFPKIFRTVRRKRRSRPVKNVTVRKTRRTYNKAAGTKKAWQIKGSLAAKRRMAQLRKMKG